MRHSLPEHSDMALKRVSILAERDAYRAVKCRTPLYYEGLNAEEQQDVQR